MPNVSRKFYPLGTLVLGVSLVVAYLLLTRGTAYIPDSLLYRYSLSLSVPYTLLTHLFVHVGLFHLVGNLVPLVLFALVLETAVVWYDVVFLFLFSGMLASLLFAFANPFITLVGASAGISGVLSAALVVKPKQTMVLLVALPLLLNFGLVPALTAANDQYQAGLEAQHQAVQTSLQAALNASAHNKSPELAAQVVALNASAQEAAQKVQTTQSGKAREASTPTDLLVHVYGVLAGLLYLYLFRRPALVYGRHDYEEIGDRLFNAWERLRGRRPR